MKNDKEKKIYGTSESVVNSTSGREMGYEGAKGPKRKIKEKEIAPWRQIKGEKVEENKKKQVDEVLKGQARSWELHQPCLISFSLSHNTHVDDMLYAFYIYTHGCCILLFFFLSFFSFSFCLAAERAGRKVRRKGAGREFKQAQAQAFPPFQFYTQSFNYHTLHTHGGARETGGEGRKENAWHLGMTMVML